MTLLAALALGLFIGAVLGALGGGGAILTVPALVYVLGQSGQDATTGSLVIVGLTAAFAMAGHARLGTVRWKLGLPFAAIGIAAAYGGTALNRNVSEQALLLGFSGLMVIAATGMLVRSHRDADADTDAEPAPAERDPGGTHPGEGSTALATKAPPAPTAARWRFASRVLLAGVLVGVLTGFFGVGGGFVIVPAMALGLGLSMPAAVGTSLLVIALNSAGALVARVGDLGGLDWAVIVPFTLAAIAGTVAGRRIAGRLPVTTLTRAFGGLLVAVALYTGTESLLRLI